MDLGDSVTKDQISVKNSSYIEKIIKSWILGILLKFDWWLSPPAGENFGEFNMTVKYE